MDLRFLRLRRWLLKQQPNKTVFNRFIENWYQIANSEPIIVREMLHDVLDAALQDVAELVDGIDLHVLIAPEPVELGAVYIIMGIKIILGNTPLLHGLPQTVVFYHFDSPPVPSF